MARESITAGWKKVRHMYGRGRAAAQLTASREKSIIELGHVAHSKIAAGHLTDPELAAISQRVDGWDRMLRELQDRREAAGGAEEAVPSAVAVHDRVGEPAAGVQAETGGQRAGVRAVWRHGIFGAFLSIMVVLALCVAISTVGNHALNQAVATGKAAVADKAQGAADQIHDKLDEAKPDKLDGKLGGKLDGKLNERAASKVQDTIQSKWSALSDVQHAADFELLNVPLTYLLVHNVASKAILHIGGNAAANEMKVHLGVYAFLLIPLLAFLIGGFAAAWRMRVKSVIQALGLALVIGAANALFLVLLTQMSGFSAAVDLPGSFGGVDVVYRFSPASALWNGFAVGVLFSLCGAMLRLAGFRWAKRFRSGSIPYGEAAFRAASAIACGVGLSLLYVLILLWAKGALSAVLAALLPQLAVYLWGIANGNVFHMTNIFAGQGKQVEVSVFAGIQGAGMGDYAADWNLYLMLAPLLPIVLLLFAGMRMRTDLGNSSRAALVFSVVYAGLMSILTMLLQIGLNMRGSTAFLNTSSVTMEAGFSALAVFATSFIVAYALVSLGLRWNRRRRPALRDRSALQADGVRRASV